MGFTSEPQRQTPVAARGDPSSASSDSSAGAKILQLKLVVPYPSGLRTRYMREAMMCLFTSYCYQSSCVHFQRNFKQFLIDYCKVAPGLA